MVFTEAWIDSIKYEEWVKLIRVSISLKAFLVYVELLFCILI